MNTALKIKKKKLRIYVTFGMLFVESLAHPCIQSFIRLLYVSPLVCPFRVGRSVKFVPRIPFRWTDIATLHESLFVLFFKFEFFVATPFRKCVSFIFIFRVQFCVYGLAIPWQLNFIYGFQEVWH